MFEEENFSCIVAEVDVLFLTFFILKFFSAISVGVLGSHPTAEAKLASRTSRKISDL